jgi:TPP-dependent pyruvate/acetoin dehydrogenase alpha subunit
MATKKQTSTVSTETSLELHRWMVWERLLDHRMNASFRAGKVMSMFHSASGHEATHVGAGLALAEGDAIVPSYRGNAIFLMRGMDLDYFVAGTFGKKEGFGQGRSMVSSHMMGDRSLGLIPMQGALGGPVATGVGAALAFRQMSRANAVLIPHGDGGSNRGDVHESMNFAAALRLPAVFLFINNGWAISVPSSYALSARNLADRAAGYGMTGVTIDGSDPRLVYEVVSEALGRARRDREPSVVEAVVRRGGAHSVNDPDLYRTDEEREQDAIADPVLRFEAQLVAEGLLDEEGVASLWADIASRIDAAIERADTLTEPGPEILETGVYAPDTPGLG